ncbi:Uncharacterised protein [Legionella lansingensis]|nr:Uncharacterised protein [Legionella lansingensis]
MLQPGNDLKEQVYRKFYFITLTAISMGCD